MVQHAAALIGNLRASMVFWSGGRASRATTTVCVSLVVRKWRLDVAESHNTQ